MKKLFLLTNVLNLFIGIILFINTYIIYEVNINIVLTFIGIIIFEVTMFVSYVYGNKKIYFVDYLINSLYYIFIIGYISFMLYYQSNNIEVLSLVYYSRFLFIPHFIYAVIMNVKM